MPGIYENLFGRAGQFKQAPPSYNPQQQQAFGNALQMGQQGLGTDAIEGAARRGYKSSTIPLLSERFANIGNRGLSGIGSSGYQNELQREGTKLETNLAALRQGNAMDLLKLGLTPQQEHYYEPGTEGQFGDVLSTGVDAAIRALAAYASGGTSEAGNIMDYFKKMFSGGQQGQPDMGNQGPTYDQRVQQQSRQSPLALLGKQYGGGGAPGENLFQGQTGTNQRLAMNAPQAINQAQQSRGPLAGQNFLYQALQNALGGSAQNAYRNQFLNKQFPGFEL